MTIADVKIRARKTGKKKKKEAETVDSTDSDNKVSHYRFLADARSSI